MRIGKSFLILAFLHAALVAAPAAEDGRLGQRIDALRVRDEALSEVVRMVGTVYGLPVVCTPQAAGVRVSCSFADVPLEVALQAMCHAHDLWLNVTPEKVVIISTLQQHLAAQAFYSTDYVEAVTVKYPSVLDVGDTLKGLFRDRIVWERPSENSDEATQRLKRTMDRMDLLSDRSQFSLSDSSSSRNSSSSYSSSYSSSSSLSRGSSSYGRSSSVGATAGSGDDTKQLKALAENRDVLNKQVQERIAHGVADDAALSALVYLSSLPEVNTLLIRSADRNAVQAVKKAISDMDKPRGQVLLKVTVLAVSLSDSLQTGIQWLIEKGQFNSGFADGSIEALSTSNAGYTTGVPVAAYISNNVKLNASLQATTENVRQLANPTLLVADNEAANVFVGKNAKFLDQITPGQTTTTNGVVTTTAATPTFQDRNIGLSLLITPRVHADRTVTLRILQERSEAESSLREINYGTNLSVKVQDISQEVVVSTLVAKDKSMVILGGLVQEKTLRTDSGVPLLRSIPLLGRLFSQKTNTAVNEELIVLIQPYVLAVPGEEHAASAEVLKALKVDPTAPVEKLGEKK